jgi:hypothetical protein
VEVAAGLRSRRLMGASVMGMAPHSRIEQGVRMILDAGRNRAGMRRLYAIPGWAVMLAMSISLALSESASARRQEAGVEREKLAVEDVPFVSLATNGVSRAVFRPESRGSGETTGARISGARSHGCALDHAGEGASR